jgi:hypothetical protein
MYPIVPCAGCSAHSARVHAKPVDCHLRGSLTPELTGAGGPKGPQGTNIGHQNREAMANVGVRVERFVRLGRVGKSWQVRSMCVMGECPRDTGIRQSVCSDDKTLLPQRTNHHFFNVSEIAEQ